MSESITLQDAAEVFILGSPYANTTKQNYQIFLTHTFAAYISINRPVNDISHSDLVRFIAWCRKERGITAATAKQYTSFLRRFFEWCYEVEYVEQNPARALSTPKSQKTERVTGVPLDDLRKLLNYTEMGHPRNHAILMFMAVTGCRVTATSRLQISKLDLLQGQAEVFEKGGRWVIYDFDELTSAALRRWLDQRPDVDHDFVWTGKRSKDKPIGAHAISSMIETLCRRLGLPKYSPHQLRHSVGEILANNDHSELAIASALNHQDLQTARHYMPARMSHTRHLRREIEEMLYPDKVQSEEKPFLRIIR
jgi:integrase/recombinase XerC